MSRSFTSDTQSDLHKVGPRLLAVIAGRHAWQQAGLAAPFQQILQGAFSTSRR